MAAPYSSPLALDFGTEVWAERRALLTMDYKVYYVVRKNFKTRLDWH